MTALTSLDGHGHRGLHHYEGLNWSHGGPHFGQAFNGAAIPASTRIGNKDQTPSGQGSQDAGAGDLSNIITTQEQLIELTEIGERFFVGLSFTTLMEDVAEEAWVDQVVGLHGVRTKMAGLQTPDGRGPCGADAVPLAPGATG